MKPAQYIKEYFASQPHGRVVTLDELKALAIKDRRELAELAAQELTREAEAA